MVLLDSIHKDISMFLRNHILVSQYHSITIIFSIICLLYFLRKPEFTLVFSDVGVTQSVVCRREFTLVFSDVGVTQSYV